MLTSDQLTEESRLLLLWKWRFLGRFSSLISASRSSVMLAAPSFTGRTFVSVQTFVFLRRWILTSSDVSFGATRTTEPVKHLPSNVVLTGAAAATSFTFLFLYWNLFPWRWTVITDFHPVPSADQRRINTVTVNSRLNSTNQSHQEKFMNFQNKMKLWTNSS